MMTPAGQRDRRIEFQRQGAGRSALGVKEGGAWASLGFRWAKVLYGSGAERRAAAQEGAVQTATFRVLADSLTRTVTVHDRVIYGGLTYDVTGIAPVGRGPAELEITGTAARA